MNIESGFHPPADEHEHSTTTPEHDGPEASPLPDNQDLSQELAEVATSEEAQTSHPLKNLARQEEEADLGQIQTESETIHPVYTNEQRDADMAEAKERLARGEIHSPQYEVSLRKILAKTPEKDKAEVERTLTEYNQQYIKNLDQVASPAYPGVDFTVSKLTITPDVVKRIYGQSGLPETGVSSASAAEATSSHHPQNKRTHFLFGALAPPPSGDAFGMADTTLDTFIRELPQYWDALRKGENPPDIEIYAVGTPTGQGGHVSQEWQNDLQQDYLSTYGKTFVDFVKQHSAQPEDAQGDEQQTIVIRGASKGALIATEVGSMLDDQARQQVVLRLDNPAGDHGGADEPSRAAKSGRVAVGLGGAIVGHLAASPTFREFGRLDGPFKEELRKLKGWEEDSAEQADLKGKAFQVEQLALFKGVAPDTKDMRTVVTRGWEDSLTQSIVDQVRSALRIRRRSGQLGATMDFDGKTTEAKVGGSHMLPYDRHNKSWIKIIASGKRRLDKLESA